MTAQQPIPLRADPAALRQAERRSLVRACAALVLGNKPGVHPELIIKTWGALRDGRGAPAGDDRQGVVARGAGGDGRGDGAKIYPGAEEER